MQGYPAKFLKRIRTIKLIAIFVFGICDLSAQNWCDSTLTVCDSIIIDSVLFTNHPENGDRIHLTLYSEHQFLHGPIFSICPEDENIDFVKDDHLFSGIVGPNSFNIFYEFENFELIQDTFRGAIILNNLNNSASNCKMEFKAALNDETTSLDFASIVDSLLIYPNPAKDFINIELADKDPIIEDVSLFDLKGIEYELNNNSTRIDISHIPKGLFVFKIKLDSQRFLTRMIVVL